MRNPLDPRRATALAGHQGNLLSAAIVVLVTGGIPPRLTAFDRMPFRQMGHLDFGPALTSRSLTTVQGDRRTTWVFVNEFQTNQTVVVAAVASRGSR